MTTSELNRDVKRLLKTFQKLDSTNSDAYFKAIDEQIKSEFLRLYHADKSLNALTKNNLLIMLRLNNKFQIVPLHQFGIYINLEKL